MHWVKLHIVERPEGSWYIFFWPLFFFLKQRKQKNEHQRDLVCFMASKIPLPNVLAFFPISPCLVGEASEREAGWVFGSCPGSTHHRHTWHRGTFSSGGFSPSLWDMEVVCERLLPKGMMWITEGVQKEQRSPAVCRITWNKLCTRTQGLSRALYSLQFYQIQGLLYKEKMLDTYFIFKQCTCLLRQSRFITYHGTLKKVSDIFLGRCAKCLCVWGFCEKSELFWTWNFCAVARYYKVILSLC